MKPFNILRILSKAILSCVVIPCTLQAQSPVANFTGSPTAGCSPLIVSFQDLSNNNPTSWLWDFGNGSTSTVQNPSATYINPGTYTVRLTVTNASGSNTMTRTNYINVYEAPVVNFTANNTSSCFPFPVQFTDQSTAGSGNTNTAWEWNFGDGNISNQQNPLHTYTSTGNYTVTLKVTNDKGCSKILVKPQYIQVATGVVANFTNPQNYCNPPDSVTFTNTSTGPGTLTYLWNFGDGGSSTMQHPTHVYNSSGSYNVTLTVTSSLGCSATIVKNNAVVIGTSTTSFNVPDTVCINSVVSFNNTSNPVPVSSNWTFGDGGSSTANSPTHIYTSTGSYIVKLVNNFTSCSDSVTKTIVVTGRPTADFSAPLRTRCQPDLTVNFQDLSTGAVSWLWNFGDGNTSTIQNPSHTYTSYGNFNVTLIAFNSSGCTDTLIKNNYVQINRPVITFTGLPNEGCIPFPINPVSNIITLDTVTSYLWNFGDGNTSTLQNPSNTYIAQGTYTVSLIITTSSGCTDTLTLVNAVRTGSKPTADFTVNNQTECAHTAVQFTDLSVPATVNQWSWNFGDGGTSGTQNPQYAYSMPGTYNVTLIAKNNGCPDTITKASYINVLPPVSRFNAMPNCANRYMFTFTDNSIGALTWFWDFGDGTTSNIANPPPHIFPSLGSYKVKLTVTNGSCSHTDSLTIKTIDENPDFISNINTLCRRDTVTFTATNVNFSNIQNYYWDFGDGTQIVTTSPTINHIYASSGDFTVMLITTDLNSCRDTIIKSNTIRTNGPVANFSGSNTGGCSGLTTTFNDLSTTDGINPIVSWQWNFGDGTIQTFTAPPFTHTYNTVGTFSVTLKVTDASGCSDSLKINNLINSTDPYVDFLTYNTSTCPGSLITWGVNTSQGSLLWDFGDGTTSTAVFPPKSYASPGIYTVKLTITDAYGCSDSLVRTNYITVDVPAANFNMNDSVSMCTPFEVTFSNTSSYYNSSFWDFNDGSTTAVQNPSHYFTTPGTYNVKLLVQSPGGCRDSITKIVTLYDTVGSRINYGPISGCKPLDVTFNVVANGNPTYIWDFGDGQSLVSNSPNIIHTYTDFGNFTPKVILQDPGGCLIPLTGINPLNIVGATAKFGLNKSLLCDNGYISFIDSTTSNDPVTSYNWDFGDGGTSASQNPTHYYNGSGFYDVQLAVTTQTGCTDTFRIPAAVKIVSNPQVRVTGDSAACVFTPVNMLGTFIVQDTSNVTWQWNFGNGSTSTLQNPAPIIYNNSGNFTTTLIATNSSGCRDTVTRNIRIHPLPTVSMPPDLTLVAGSTASIPAVYSGNMTSYLWTPSTFLSCTTCPQPQVTPDYNMQYTVSFSDSNSCQNTGTILIKALCKNANVFVPNTFSPNGDGSNDYFFPRGTGIERARFLRIFNRWGEVVFEKYDFPVNNASQGWDGTSKGKKANSDVYIYQLELYCQNGEIITSTGNITLIR